MRENTAIRIFERACRELRKLGPEFSLYVGGSTLCLMRGPSHDDSPEANPLRENIVAAGHRLPISGGDW